MSDQKQQGQKQPAQNPQPKQPAQGPSKNPSEAPRHPNVPGNPKEL